MSIALLLILVALRAGLSLRRVRRGGSARNPRARVRHLRFAKPGVLLVAVGFLGGPASMIWLRDRQPFDTAHALFGATALLLFSAAAWLGRNLERGRGNRRDAHALLGVLGVLVAALAAVAGFDLLP